MGEHADNTRDYTGPGMGFEKGNPGWNYTRAKREAEAETPVEVSGESPVELLKAMRKVANQPKAADRGHLQKNVRVWLDTDTKGFFTKLADLEKQQKAGSTPADGYAASEDEGSARILALLKDWQKKFLDEHKDK